MKTLTIILFLTFSTVLHGQSDSLSIVKLNYTIEKMNFIDKEMPIATFDALTNVLEYYTGQGNNWISFKIPIDFIPFSVYHYPRNLDMIGKPEIIVTGEIKTQINKGDLIRKALLIFNIDSIPTQIFKVYYGCYVTSISDTTKIDKEMIIKYERDIQFTDSSFVVAPLDKKKYSCKDCMLTDISDGTYIMINGQIRKKE